MLTLRTRADLQRLVDERLGESLTLEYKASPALNRTNDGRSELVKDATAMANSAGGQIVYGIAERKGVPTGIDEGVDRTVITPEWIGQVLTTNTSPRLQDIEITAVPLEEGTNAVAYVLTIPQGTVFAPHQNTMDHKYYRRFEQRAVPMADYEIRDILRRAQTPLLQVRYRFPNKNDRVEVQKGNAMFSVVPMLENVGPEPSLYSMFELLIDERLLVHSYAESLLERPKQDELGYTCRCFQQLFMVPDTFPFVAGTHVTLVPENLVLEIPDEHYTEGEFFVVGYSAVSAQGCKVAGFQGVGVFGGQLVLSSHRLLSLNGQRMISPATSKDDGEDSESA